MSDTFLADVSDKPCEPPVHKFRLPIPKKGTARVRVPFDLDAKDMALLNVVFTAAAHMMRGNKGQS